VPKIKTHKATAKRFRRTRGGKGRLRRPKLSETGKRRVMHRRTRTQFDKMLNVESPGVKKRVRRLAPYLKE
jgi:ribosomal protein L35